MSQVDQFVTLLNQMKSHDNKVRRKAENIFNKTKDKQANETLQALLQIARTHTDANLRAYCYILLKKMFNDSDKKKPFFLGLNGDVQGVYKVELLIGAEKEPVADCKKYICDVISDVATVTFMNGGAWDEVIQWVINMGSQNVAESKLCSFRILKEISPYFVELPHIKQNFGNVVQMLANGIGFADIKVKLESLQASISVIHAAVPFRDMLQNLIEPLFSIISSCLEAKDDESAQTAIQCFIDLAELDPGFFFPKLDSITEAMMSLASNQNLSLDVNRLAAEFLVSLCENKREMCKKNSNFVGSCIQILLQMILNIPDIDVKDWEDELENDEIENFAVAEEYLDRLSLALGGEVIMPLIWNFISQFMHNENWKYRYTSMKSLSMIAEGCSDVMISGLGDVVNMFVKCMDDPEPRVRHAAIHAIGQFSTDFGPHLQNKHHEVLLPKMISLLRDKSSPRIQTHSAAATVNFCEKFDSPLIEPYLNDLISVLCSLINESTIKCQEQAMLALSITLVIAKKKIIPFYATLMPTLLDIFRRASNDKKLRALRGKTMLAISSLAMSSGKDCFEKDAPIVLNLLKEAEEKIIDNDDPQEEYFIDAWHNIATGLREHFAPYLEHIIPPLIESALREVEFHVQEGDEVDDDVGEFYTLEDDTRIVVDFAEVQEKTKACSLLANYALSVREAFFPYVERVSNIFTPLVDYPYNEQLKVASLVGIPSIIKCARIYVTKNNLDRQILLNLFNYMFPRVFEEAKKENEPETYLVALESIHQCIHAAGENCLTPEMIVQIFDSIKIWIEEFRRNRNHLIKSNPENDSDHSKYIREELQREDSFTAEIAEILTSTIKHNKQIVMDVFIQSKMIDYVIDLLKNPQSDCEKQIAICIFDDLVEHCREQSYPLFEHFLPTILENIKNPNTAIRQAITFGAGVYAQFGGSVIQPYIEAITSNLIEIISSPDSRNKSFASSTENGISSIGKIIEFQPQVLGTKLGEVATLWLSWLPLEIDYMEAKIVHKQLCNFIKSNNSHILGDNFANLPRILAVFADIIGSRLVKKETTREIIEIVKGMQTQIPIIIQAAFQTLPQNKQERLLRQF